MLDKMSSSGAGNILAKELFFEYGIEGGGTKIYRYKNENGKELFMAESSSGGIEPDEEIRNREKKYDSWIEFWQKFTANREWFYCYAIYVKRFCNKIFR